MALNIGFYAYAIIGHTRADQLLPQLLMEHFDTLHIQCRRCPCVRACVCASVCASVRPSVTFCFFNILKSHRWIFIKPCKYVHICKTNTLDKKVRARGQFYYSYFPL